MSDQREAIDVLDRQLGEYLTNAVKATNELAAWGRGAVRAMEEACLERDVAQRDLAQLQEELKCGAINRAAAEAIGGLAQAQQEAYDATFRAQAAESKLDDMERQKLQSRVELAAKMRLLLACAPGTDKEYGFAEGVTACLEIAEDGGEHVDAADDASTWGTVLSVVRSNNYTPEDVLRAMEMMQAESEQKPGRDY